MKLSKYNFKAVYHKNISNYIFENKIIKLNVENIV